MLPYRSKAIAIYTLAASLTVGLTQADETKVSEPEQRAEATERVLDRILAKEGISLGGVFRAQYQHASIGGPGAAVNRPSEESAENTSVDFDLKARPNTMTQGHLIFRMHQDWRNFFSDIGNPILSRWISIDGNVGGMFKYNAGDFRQKYSPLTMYSPDIEVMYEPYQLAQRRQETMDEVFLGNNERMMQGVNLNFDASVSKDGKGLIHEMHVNALGSRLRNVETSIKNGGKPTAYIEVSPAEKFLGAGNMDLVLPAGVSLGGSYLHIFDKIGSSASTFIADTAAQKTTIFAGRLAWEAAPLLNAENWSLGLSTEFASSKDDSNYYAARPDSTLHKSTIDGTALFAGLHGSWKKGTTFGIQGKVNFIKNEATYRNEMAQSPSYLGERIMNVENDTTALLKRVLDVRAPHYSTFDAMYNHVFKFAPQDGTNMWQKAPFQKLSYTKSIMTQSEMASFAAQRTDVALQLVMPFGPATANRTGLQSEFTFTGWEDRIEVKTVLAQLDEITGRKIDTVRALPATHFTQAGGGMKLEVGSMLGLTYPITLSGSMVRSTAKNDGIAGDTVFVSQEITSDFINVGARIQIWKRFAVLGAYQKITNTMVARALESTQTQDNMGGGIEYKVAAAAYVTGTVDKIGVAYTGLTKPENDFHQLQTNLYLSVHF